MASWKPHPHHSPSKPLWINISPLSHQVLHSRGAEVGLHSWVPNMRLWCRLWASFNLEDPRFRPHTWEETHSSVSKDRPACWSLVGGLRGWVISGSFCTTLAYFCPCLSQQGNSPRSCLGLKTRCHFKLTMLSLIIRHLPHARHHLVTNGLMFYFACSWRSLATGWPHWPATPPEDGGLVLWVPWAVLFTTTTFDFETKERLWAQITNLITFSFGDALLWSCAVGFYFQKIQVCFFSAWRKRGGATCFKQFKQEK